MKLNQKLRLADLNQRMEWHSERLLGQKTYFWGSVVNHDDVAFIPINVEAFDA